MKCNKIKYKNFDEANRAYKKYQAKFLFSSINIYWCKRHLCYHLGHDKFASNKKILSTTINKFDLSKISKEIFS